MLRGWPVGVQTAVVRAYSARDPGAHGFWNLAPRRSGEWHDPEQMKMEADSELAMKSPRVFTMMVRTASAPKFPNQSSWESERGLWSGVMVKGSPGWNSIG